MVIRISIPFFNPSLIYSFNFQIAKIEQIEARGEVQYTLKY